MTEPDDEVRAMIAHTVADSKRRIVFSPDAPAIHDRETNAYATDPTTGEEVILVPDPEELIEMRCAAESCQRRVLRKRREIERMNRKYGFPYCRKKCRNEKLAEKERIFNPDRVNDAGEEL